jgi:hypothetical protein
MSIHIGMGLDFISTTDIAYFFRALFAGLSLCGTGTGADSQKS